MDASLPTGKELRPLNAKSMNSRLSGSETSSNRGGSSDGYPESVTPFHCQVIPAEFFN